MKVQMANLSTWRAHAKPKATRRQSQIGVLQQPRWFKQGRALPADPTTAAVRLPGLVDALLVHLTLGVTSFNHMPPPLCKKL
ncbi:hypothetical protein GCM10027346_40510 [Hymenobacter seoulensis]